MSRLSMEAADSICKILGYRAAQSPDRVAFIFVSRRDDTDRQLTYAELDWKARAIAGWLQSQNACKRPVALIFPPGPDYVAALFGTLYAGSAAVPLKPRGSTSRWTPLASVLRDIQCPIALTTESLLSHVNETAAHADAGLVAAAIEHVPNNAAGQWRAVDGAQDALAVIQYTSGSTATPRGVKIRHRNILHNLDLMARVMGLDDASVGVSWLPHYHDMGLVGGILLPVFAGFPVALISSARFLTQPQSWLRAISRYRATVSGGPNFAYELCARRISEEDLDGIDLSSWRVAFTGAEPIRRATIDRFTRRFAGCGFQRSAIFPCYGLAEATLMVTGGPEQRSCFLARALLGENQLVERNPHSPDATEVSASGALLPDHRIAIVDPDRRTRCREDQIGEIWIASGSVGDGYWNRPDETREVFEARLPDGEGPFLRTGDLGFIREGMLFITGRLKELIIVRGLNHYAPDIEQTAEDSHEVLRTGCGAALSVDSMGEERIVLVYELHRHARVSAQSIFQVVSADIAERHGLQVFALVLIKEGTLPRTSSGKVQRRRCREQLLAGSLRIVDEWGIRDPDLLLPERPSPTVAGELGGARPAEVEAILAAELAAALNVEPQSIDRQQSFYALGLDSLMAARLSGRLEQLLGVSLPVADLLRHPTVEKLAIRVIDRHVRRASGGSTSEIRRLIERVDQLSEEEVVAALEAERARAKIAATQ